MNDANARLLAGQVITVLALTPRIPALFTIGTITGFPPSKPRFQAVYA
jgi:hypothetical protein